MAYYNLIKSFGVSLYGIDFENGVIVKIYKSQVDPILVWGYLRQPKTKMVSPLVERFLKLGFQGFVKSRLGRFMQCVRCNE